MKKINSKSFAMIIVIITIQIGFVISLYLATWIANSEVVLSANVVLILNISKTLSLFGGIGWIIWLLKNKYKATYTWKDMLPFILALLLIEYWYFIVRLFSLLN